MDKKFLIRLSIAMSVGVLLLVNVAATYETYGRDGYLREKLQAAVEAGKITQEQANRKLDSMSNRKAKRWKQWDTDSLREKLQAAVEAGKISQEQADRKIDLISNRKAKRWKQWDTESLREKLQAAVETGKITQEQVDEKLQKIDSMKGDSWKHRKPNGIHKNIP